MKREVFAAAAAVALLVACEFVWFPGHTYLHSDTQIYAPILERLSDPSLFTSDLVAQRPHVSYTIYDETARGLRRLTGLDLPTVLHAQQILFRMFGVAGVLLIGRALGFSWLLALLFASVYGLGGTIGGPSVLIHEYEPVPRGFAGAILWLAVGLFAHARMFAGGCALGLAVMYHPPTTYPVVLVMLGWTLWRRDVRRDFRRDFRWLGPVAAAVVLTAVLSKLQAGETEAQRFLGVIDAPLEKLQRLRGSYNWVSMWGVGWIRHQQLMLLIALAALWRLRPPAMIRWILTGLALTGAASMPVSYLLLETMKWQFMPQFQPMRAALFVPLAALLACAACGIIAGRAGRTLESWAWFVVAFTVPTQPEALPLLLPDWRDAAMWPRVGCVWLLALLAALASRWEASAPMRARAAAVLAMALPFWLLPGPAQVRNYRDQDQPEVRELAGWARANTAKSAVFMFPDAGQELYPGFFRAYSLRNVYADWKGGGQVNLLRDFAIEWWDRWEKGTAKGKPLSWFAGLGIDYVVYKSGAGPADAAPAWRNAKYAAYATSPW